MKLFISYASVDKSRVRPLESMLQERGYDVWFEQRLISGQDWKPLLHAAIQTSDIFVYVLTPDSTEAAWCQWQAAQAIRLYKPIVAVLWQARTPIPPSLADSQLVDFSGYITSLVVDELEVALKSAQPVNLQSVAYSETMPAGLPPQFVASRFARRLLMVVAMLLILLVAGNAIVERVRNAVQGNDAIVYYNSGLELLLDEEYTAAINAFTRAIELDPKLAEAFNDRGNAYFQIGEFEQAMIDYNRAVELKPDFALAHLNTGNVYHEMGDSEQAIAAYTLALELDPELALAYNNRAYQNLVDGRFLEAIEDYDRAISLDPNYVLALSNRGLAYLQAGRLSLALDDLNQAIELDPSFGQSYHSRGVVYVTMASFEQARDDFTRAIELDPNWNTPYSNRGFVYLNLEEYDLAFEDFQQSIELNAMFANAYWGLGNVYYERAEYALALENYERYVELVTNNPDSFVVGRIEELEACIPTDSCGE
jgi:tetratricopeptide (TPR) repeat protein